MEPSSNKDKYAMPIVKFIVISCAVICGACGAAAICAAQKAQYILMFIELGVLLFNAYLAVGCFKIIRDGFKHL